ncbi:MAG: nuclear transport factor 2 family protein [Erysipelotrichaceae bacterium]|nr:nuclear transport factor 2 family protein [Erysipelotrichaceae bacterium]
MNDELTDLLRKQEEWFFQAAFLLDRTLLDRYLHPDFLEYGRSGTRYDKAAIIDLLYGSGDRPIMIRDFNVQQLSSAVAVVHYLSMVKDRQTYRTSIWVFEQGIWQLFFHQGTDKKD